MSLANTSLLSLLIGTALSAAALLANADLQVDIDSEVNSEFEDEADMYDDKLPWASDLQGVAQIAQLFAWAAMLSMVVHHGLKVDLPSAGSVSLEKEDYIAITIDADNRLFLNKEPTEANGLAARVRALRGNEAKPVFINGDQKADLGLAIELLDDLKKAGIEEVSFSCTKETP